jgi:heme/copper-type cytochrome/quinol oxidase subunit 2
MTKQQATIIIVFAVVVLSGVIVGVLTKNGEGPLFPGGPNGEGVSTSTPTNGVPSGFTSDIPDDATLSVPKNEAPASANSGLDTKLKFFNLKASAGGFTPASITVNRGDSLSIDFTAVDGDYDLDIPYLGAYFSVVKKGSTKKFPIDTNLPGTFTFLCRDFCPGGKTISGQLIVLP